MKVIKKKLGQIKFSLEFDNKKFSFDYSLNSKSKKHTFNNIDLTTKKNVLRKRIGKRRNNKSKFTKNANISIFSNKLTKKINASKYQKIENNYNCS